MVVARNRWRNTMTKLAKIMKCREINVTVLSKMCHEAGYRIGYSTCFYLHKGLTKPCLYTAYAIAKVLGLSVETIFPEKEILG
jgi:DNA-binding XRE family transcriptional regulator